MIKGLNLKSEIVKYILVLMSGTVIAQLISYLLAPVITRLYTPAEAAEMGLYVRIISVGAAIATARYELALPIIKNHTHAFRLYRFTLRVLVNVILACLIVVSIPAFLSNNASDAFFYLSIPVALGFLALMNLGTNWSIRQKKFKVITYSKITNSLSGNLAKVGLGFLGVGYVGLIIGTVVGLVLGGFFFLYDFFKSKNEHQVSTRSSRNFLIAKEYSEFPRINLPHTLMDLGRDLLVALIIWQLYEKEDYGLYNHSYQMLRIPLVLVGSAIGQVFFQKCAQMVNEGKDIYPLALKSVRTLTLLSIVPFSVIFFYGEEMFAFVFGEDWRGAGTYSEIMAPWFLVNFIASPISSLPLILRKQKAFFKIAVVGSVLMLAALALPKLIYDVSIETNLWILSLTQMVYLVFVIFKIFGFIRNTNLEKN